MRNTEEMQSISDDIQKVTQAAPHTTVPKLFYFVGASSGRGKSQMAESLGFPVVYIPLIASQYIYKCFSTISVAVADALQEDFLLLFKETHGAVMEKASSFRLYGTQTEFRTVGLLVELFGRVWGKSNEEAIKLLSGRDSGSNFTYKRMKLQDAREAIAKQLLSAETATSSGGAAKSRAVQQQINDTSIPVFMIDEAPPLLDRGKHVDYEKCILLRNLIRCMNCVCLLCGTEAAAMNTIDILSVNTRGDSSREYMRLITRLPPTNWEIFERDDRLARVIAALNSDVRAMLQRTRPLFAQHVLEVMLLHQSSEGGGQPRQQHADASSGASDSEAATAATLGQLTSNVLSMAKQNILDQNSRFSTLKGLYAQTMLVHSQFFAYPVDEYKREFEDDEKEEEEEGGSRKFKRQRKLSLKEREQLMAEMQSCVRHHYGEMRPANSGISLDRPLPLFVCPDESFMSVKIEQKVNKLSGSTVGTTLMRFLPNVAFAEPCEDELLYLICLRNGMIFEKQRVSSSFALRKIFLSRESGGGKLANNTMAPACSGRFLETEVITASVVASHSFDGGLSGCPLSFFLRSLVAELNIGGVYVAEADFTLEVPQHYEKISVGMMSAVNTSWQPEQSAAGEGCCWMQGGSILLTDVDWSANKAENDAAFPVMMEDEVHRASMEMKCMEGSTATSPPLTGTIEKNGKNNHLITIMVVNKGAEITANNKIFNTAKQGHNVIKISGNASETEKVGKVLTWKVIHEHNAAAPCGTVVQVELDTIYWGRYEKMKSIYRST